MQLKPEASTNGENELAWIGGMISNAKAKEVGAEGWQKEFRKYCARRLDGVSTGIEVLDKVLLGLRGITIIQGSPGVTKSTLALQIAHHHARQAGPVIFYDRENGINRLRMRLLCQALELAETDILTKGLPPQDPLAGLPFWVVNHLGLDELDPLIGELVGAGPKKKTVMLVVDSLQKLPKKFEDNKRLSVDYWMEGFDQLKLKYESNYVALVISEKNRGHYDEASLGGSKESGDNEYTGEVILDLRENKKTRDLILNIVKDRDGMAGFECNFVKELSDPNNPRSFIYKLKPLEVGF